MLWFRNMIVLPASKLGEGSQVRFLYVTNGKSSNSLSIDVTKNVQTRYRKEMKPKTRNIFSASGEAPLHRPKRGTFDSRSSADFNDINVLRIYRLGSPTSKETVVRMTHRQPQQSLCPTSLASFMVTSCYL